MRTALLLIALAAASSPALSQAPAPAPGNVKAVPAGPPVKVDLGPGASRDWPPAFDVTKPEKTPLSPGMYVFRFPVAGIPRTWGVYVPRRFNPEGGPPLGAVVVLHDTGSSGKDFLALGKWREAAEQRPFVIIAPDAAPDASGKPGAFTKSDSPANVDELARHNVMLVRRIFELLGTRGNVDPNKLYVAGHGTGGRMAAILGFELSGMVAGVGSVGGPISVDAKLPHPVALALVHGRKDTVFPLSGGKTPVEPLWRDWAGQLGCSTKIATFPGIPGLLAQSATDCVSGSEAALFVVDDTGHGWPTTFDTAGTILDLFLRRPLLPRAPHKGVITFK
ncbi:MAG: hypothetical protein JNK60_06040 [Acidobacteria bacterium]|nr:hypothetical protein [Acidobacteriota bacterium]